MAVYFVTGELGSGKTLAVVNRIQDYLVQGRRVATNINLRLEHLMRRGEHDVLRLPDWPKAADLFALGEGFPKYEESRFGGIFLDEAATYLNARDWNAAGRSDFMKWLLHARKLRWDVYFIVQDLKMIDSQMRAALCEHLVLCYRWDRVALPLVGPLFRLLKFKTPKLPHLHSAVVKYGSSHNSPVSDTWTFQGKHLYKAYDTMQKLMGESPLSTYDGLSCTLDAARAPWMRRPTGVREFYWDAYCRASVKYPRIAAWLPVPVPSAERLAFLDFQMAEEYGPPAKPAVMYRDYAAWLRDTYCACLARTVDPSAGACVQAESANDDQALEAAE